MAKTVHGRERIWEIQELIGSGDAGEVLRVVSQPGNLQGVMKRPVQNVSGGTIVRQAGQIETEGKILAALDGINFSKNEVSIHTPLLLDRSIEGTSNTANLFMVSEEIKGKSISSLLADRLTTGQPIPQNVVLKVLSSLLLLLEIAHSKGVVWNDIKMDHIFWNPITTTMSFIDWGNGIFFQPQPDLENSPVWQDYTQMFEEGFNLLNQASSNVIDDLDWPLHSSEITLNEIPQLRMRVEYYENYLTMRAIEYELFFERFTNSLTNIDALRQALELNEELRKFGIISDLSRLRAASEILLIRLLAERDFGQVDRMLNVVETSLKETLSIQWKLASYLLKLKKEIPSDELSELLKFVFACDWAEAIWKARNLIGRDYSTRELASVVYAMRDLFFDSSSVTTVYADMLKFLSQLEEQLTYLKNNASLESELGNRLISLHKRLQVIVSHWSTLSPGEALGNQLFNLRQIISEATVMRLRLPDGFSDRLQKALASMREIYQCWNSADIEGCLKSTKKLYTIEPTLDFLLPLAASFSRMKANLADFEDGPEADQTVNTFASALLAQSEDLHKHLGAADWLVNYDTALREMSRANNLENLQDLGRKQNWPTQWVFQPNLKLDVPYVQLAQTMLTDEQKIELSTFHENLHLLQSSAEQLLSLRQYLPSSYGSYKELDEEFQFIFSGIPREPYSPDLKNFPAEDTDQVKLALKVLTEVNEWKKAAESGEWSSLKSMTDGFEPGWVILDDLKKATFIWVNEILPIITDLKQRKWKSTRYKEILKPTIPELSDAQAHLYTFICEWHKIEHQGLYPELLNELIYQSDAAQKDFFDAWQKLSSSDSAVLTWLAQNQQGVLSEINQVLLTLYRSLRELQRNFEVINQLEMARTRLASNAAGDLMFLLIKLDETINPDHKANPVFKRWQRQYLDLLSVADSTKIRQGIQEIEGIHPLLPWFDELVRRDAGYFEQPAAHRW